MAIRNMHFIAGLPRSGSTLLAGILRQNVQIHADMSSPVEHIFSSAIEGMSGQNHFSRFITDKQREAVLRGIFESYYAETASAIIFDTNRNWPAKLPALSRLFPEAKVLCCVRDLVSVVNSFEHLIQNNPYTVSRMFRWDASMTVYDRFERLMSADGPIGRALNALKEGYYGPYKDRLFFVEYDELTAEPAETVGQIYRFVKLPHFTHDFDNISYRETSFDSILGLRDMHTVRPSVSKMTRTVIIPDDLIERLRGLEFWKLTSKNDP